MRLQVQTLSSCASFLFGTVLALSAQPAFAALSLSNTPLFLTVSVPPNIVLTLDDSGSMRRAFVPENCNADTSDCDLLDNRYEKSARRNLTYYNPAITYPQPKAANGTTLTTSFTAAYRNGFDRSGGTMAQVNLASNYKPTAYLDLVSGTVTEAYMGHNATDFRCNTTAVTPRCQYSLNSGSTWVTDAAAASCPSSLGTATIRHNFCRGTEGSGYNPAGMPAYYYVFDATNSPATCAAAGAVTNNICYDLKLVTSTSGPGGTDERQNFANWYSFARTRNLATQTAASIAFFDLDQTARVGWQALNSCNGGASLVDTDCDGWKSDFSGVSNAIRPFTGTHRTNFLNWVQQQPTANGTPLPSATQRVGAYYSTGGENSPYDNDFSTSNSGEHSCRRNYHILMTDGIWTTSQGGTPQDTATYNLPQSVNGVTQYTPMAPYNSSSADTLADVAFRYSITDLRPGAALANGVTPIIKDTTGTPAEQFWNPKNDPYPWQHMVNYTIGLGLSGYLPQAGLTWAGNTYTGSYPDIANGMTAWPVADTTANNAGNVADLWHAAINSRGQFFSADDPASLAQSFAAVIGAITGDSGSSAALSANSTSIQPGNTYVYQAKFNKDWSGTLLAFQVNDTTGAITGTNNWDASTLIPAHGSRRIFTHNGVTGVEFRLCTSLGVTQQAALALNSSGVPDLYCQNRLDWLRGSSADEQRSNSVGSLKLFRNRPTNIMGDIVNSDPAYVKSVDYGYGNLPDGTAGKTTYAAYLAATGDPMTGRQPMVYVGSNDGRLYGIKATASPEPNSGAEIFSYVPAGVYTNLGRLTDPNYTHRFYVDGGVTAGDAYLTLGATTAWRTIVVGGLNAGGRSIYALNVTDPAGAAAPTTAAAAAATVVMWEYTETDLGLTYSQPQIGLMQNGTDWVAVFGNGYNSTEGGAYLYIVNLATGALIRKIPVGTNVIGVDDNNGLSTPYLYDSDGDKKIDTIYAGDLQGRMWKFNVTGASGTWGVAFPGTPNGAPLFTARNASNQVQPITAQPKAAGHPLGGHMVVFGTGRYLALGDVTDTAVQTFYGIRDYGSTPITTTNRSELQQQTISLQVNNQFNRDVRAISNNIPDWNTEKGWYLDLLDPVAPPNDAIGERVVSTSLLLEGRVIFVTIVPSQDPCLPGGFSWLMELDLVNGGTFPDSILDLNNDSLFNTEDEVQGEVVSGVRNNSLGLSKTPVVIGAGAGNMAFKELTGTRGAFATEKNKLGTPPPPPPGSVSRRSWIQIR
jgi:type IV pilus assembly protein PilY1